MNASGGEDSPSRAIAPSPAASRQLLCENRTPMLRVHVFEHAPFEGPANLAVWLRARGAALATTRLWAGDPLPAPDAFDWLLVMGGAMNADEEVRFPWLADEKRAIERAIAARKHVLGICLGSQLIARVLGARVTRNRHAEIGWFPIERVEGAEASPVGRALPPRAEVFHWHGDTFALPEGAVQLARSAACEQQGFAYGNRVLALQFHPEMTPESVRAFAEGGADELLPGPWIQTREAMLEGGERFARLEALLARLLEAFAAGARD
jgi:GMP synthase-like glutamine amidotransferase